MKTKQMTLLALLTALLCIAGPLTFPLPFSPVPLSLATLVVSLAAFLLGWKKGMFCCLLYILIGIIGIPVFSGFSAGFGKILGPTGGYLIGYFFLAFFTGFFAENFPTSRILQFVGILLGTAFLQFLGTFWLAFLTHTTLLQASLSAVVPFLFGDTLKILLVLLFAPLLKRYLMRTALLP